MSKRFVNVALICGALVAGAFCISADAQQSSRYRYADGKEVYERICQACHMPTGQGAAGAGAYPALAGNPKLENPLYIVAVVLNGLKSMPAFADLSDEEIAGVANYIRSHFGNEFSERVTTEQVKGLRPNASGLRSNARSAASGP